MPLLAGCADLSTEAQKAAGAEASGPAAAPSSAPSPMGPTTPQSAPALPPPKATGPTKRVEADGISFAVPKRWLALDADELADGAADSEVLEQFAENAGVSKDQLLEVMRSVDLYLVSDEGARGGFVDNVNVFDQAGALPNDSTLELSMIRFGAKDVHLTHRMTDDGDVAVAAYDMELAGHHIDGTMLALQATQGAGFVTFSAGSPERLHLMVQLFLASVKSTDATIG